MNLTFDDVLTILMDSLLPQGEIIKRFRRA
jgi:hypothetical protein